MCVCVRARTCPCTHVPFVCSQGTSQQRLLCLPFSSSSNLDLLPQSSSLPQSSPWTTRLFSKEFARPPAFWKSKSQNLLPLSPQKQTCDNRCQNDGHTRGGCWLGGATEQASPLEMFCLDLLGGYTGVSTCENSLCCTLKNCVHYVSFTSVVNRC